ncbi:MAG TPA: thioredoxin domain-containing protein [Casimicrobiaceae bacterium]|nr:thioredoxin domain-containing protein [Casimicrobiaceae bacterium]
MPNRLAGETSPYLLQHADNPVDWFPWGDEAFALARREGKPVLLSIGYSACHWCHVMAHESFEDDEVAAAMNRDFVNVKVDREERPDVDRIYQTAQALMTRRSGGWPLTVFMTPDGNPFYAGTYFPKRGRHGLPGFIDLLPHIARVYRERKDAIGAQGAEVRRALQSLEPRSEPDATLPHDASGRALDELKSTFDRVRGGFGEAPKFPHVTELEFALNAYLANGDADALAIARVSALRMADGGIHDQLGGGFARYSVDANWEIPHFEKMLYDNGPLLGLYADLSRSADARLKSAAEGIVDWLTREMRAEDGAFYSSLDADSDGEEGKFYVWQRDEVQALLDDATYVVASRYYGLDRAPNFEGHAWNLVVAMPLDHVAAELGVTVDAARARLDVARRTLLAAREKRVRPGLDDKILTSWNALAVAGLARASRRLAQPQWADLAVAALDSLRRNAWRDGKLLATRKGERAHLDAYLDDYAFLLAALDEMMQTRFRRADYQWAREIADSLLLRFEDPAAGGFFFTAHDHEALIHRTKPGHDNATPSGNGVAASALIAFATLASEPRYSDAAERTVKLFAPRLADDPRGFSSLLRALDDLITPPTIVILDGEPAAVSEWHRQLGGVVRAGIRIYNIAGVDVPAELRKGPLGNAPVTAWVCQNTTCLAPMTTLDQLVRTLDHDESTVNRQP